MCTITSILQGFARSYAACIHDLGDIFTARCCDNIVTVSQLHLYSTGHTTCFRCMNAWMDSACDAFSSVMVVVIRTCWKEVLSPCFICTWASLPPVYTGLSICTSNIWSLWQVLWCWSYLCLCMGCCFWCWQNLAEHSRGGELHFETSAWLLLHTCMLGCECHSCCLFKTHPCRSQLNF